MEIKNGIMQLLGMVHSRVKKLDMNAIGILMEFWPKRRNGTRTDNSLFGRKWSIDKILISLEKLADGKSK